MSGGRASARVFSGRPDPAWDVDAGVVHQLEEIWRTLDVFDGPPPAPPPLGYRGCTLDVPDIAYVAFGGVVTRHDRSGVVGRADAFRRFERILLESAPAGSFPDSVLRSLDEPA